MGSRLGLQHRACASSCGAGLKSDQSTVGYHYSTRATSHPLANLAALIIIASPRFHRRVRLSTPSTRPSCSLQRHPLLVHRLGIQVSQQVGGFLVSASLVSPGPVTEAKGLVRSGEQRRAVTVACIVLRVRPYFLEGRMEGREGGRTS